MKNNLSLIFSILLPVLFIIFVVLMYFIPRLITSPSFDYIYFENSFNTHYYYDIVENKISLEESEISGYSKTRDEKPDLYLHNTEENYSEKITLEEAKDFVFT